MAQQQQQQQETDKQHASWQLPVWPQCQAHPHPKTETKARDKINKKILFEQSTSLPLLLRRRRLSWKPNKSHNNNNNNGATEQQLLTLIEWLPPASTAPAAYVPLQKLTRASLQIAVNVVIGIDSICSGISGCT